VGRKAVRRSFRRQIGALRRPGGQRRRHPEQEGRQSGNRAGSSHESSRGEEAAPSGCAASPRRWHRPRCGYRPGRRHPAP
jgi:hypothetical protein